ncbi:MAG: hypothetical protein AAF502_11475 [Bacteroidota bacterium]
MKNSKLRSVLYANAAFSGLSGVAMAIFHEKLALWMQIPLPYVLVIIGIGLILFSGTLIMAARKSPIPGKDVNMIIIQDWLWVAVSILIIITQAFGLNSTGYWVIGIVALIVADFAILQQYFKNKTVV